MSDKVSDEPLTVVDRLRLHVEDPETFAFAYEDADDLLAYIDTLRHPPASPDIEGPEAATDRAVKAEEALEKISAIRDSIIGAQTVNWSEHIYPLVAALGEAGFQGAGYEISRKNVGTLIENFNAAEARALAAEASLAQMAGDGWQDIATAPPTDHMNQILLAWKHRPVSTGWWDVDDAFADRPKGWISPEEGWRSYGDQCIPVEDGWPTHWRPLPTPPATALQNGGGDK